MSGKNVVSKQNIFLDLDQTIISGEEVEKLNYKKFGKKMKKFNYSNMDNYYYIFERPGLQRFLDYLFENFNVSVWTAASKDYALFIVQNIILKRKENRNLDYIFFSYHCDLSSELTGNTKDLSIIWNYFKIKNYNEYNTFILDDYIEVYNTQRYNCLRAKPFYFYDKYSENDYFLMDTVYNLEKIRKSKYEKNYQEKIREVVKSINKV